MHCLKTIPERLHSPFIKYVNNKEMIAATEKLMDSNKTIHPKQKLSKNFRLIMEKNNCKIMEAREKCKCSLLFQGQS